MKKMYLLAVLAIMVLTFVCIVGVNGSNSQNIDFLKSYGWSVKRNPVETVNFTIPEKFDAVYKNYNELQLEAGLDLEDYKGKRATRYTYLVQNFPKDTDVLVRANVICVEGKPVAGDIMTTELDGFMYSLNCNINEI